MEEKDERWKEGMWKGRRVIRVEGMKERKMQNHTKFCKREQMDGQMDRLMDRWMDKRNIMVK